MTKYHCDKDYVKKILENPDILYKLHNGQSLYTIAGLKSLDCLRSVHNAYLFTLINTQFEDNMLPYNIKDNEGKNVLHTMIMMNYKPQIDYLINTIKINVNEPDIYKNTPLHYATKLQRIDIIKLLLNSGIKDINAINNNHETPLLIAILLKNYEIIKLLLKSGALMSVKRGRFILNINEYIDDEKIPDKIKELLKKHFDLKLKKPKTIIGKKQIAEKIKNYNIEYTDLCNNMDTYDMDVIKLLASEIGLVYPENISKPQLCSKIAERLRIFYSNPMMIRELNKN